MSELFEFATQLAKDQMEVSSMKILDDELILEWAKNVTLAEGGTPENIDLECAKRKMERFQEQCDRYGSD